MQIKKINYLVSNAHYLKGNANQNQKKMKILYIFKCYLKEKITYVFLLI